MLHYFMNSDYEQLEYETYPIHLKLHPQWHMKGIQQFDKFFFLKTKIIIGKNTPGPDRNMVFEKTFSNQNLELVCIWITHD